MKQRTVISVVNQKGGVGKTTCTVNLGAALASLGRQVCLLDNDPQMNLSSHLLNRDSMSDPNMLTAEDIYRGQDLSKKRLMHVNLGMTLIPTIGELVGMDHVLHARKDGERILKNSLETLTTRGVLRGAEVILIDNPPSLDHLSRSALIASTHVLIPIQLEYFSLEGLARMRKTVEEIRARENPNLKILGILPSMVKARRRLNADVRDALESAFPSQVFSHHIRTSVALPEAAGFAKTLLEYAPRSAVASDFRSVAEEVIRGIEI